MRRLFIEVHENLRGFKPGSRLLDNSSWIRIRIKIWRVNDDGSFFIRPHGPTLYLLCGGILIVLNVNSFG
jgi:hypothetical protein